MNEKPVQHAIQRRDFRQVDLENEAVFSGDSMTFHHLRNLLGKRRDFRQVSGQRPDSDECSDLVSRCFWIQFEAIAGDDAAFFQTSNTLLRCGIGHSDFSGQLGDRHPWILLQELQNFNIFAICQYSFNIHNMLSKYTLIISSSCHILA